MAYIRMGTSSTATTPRGGGRTIQERELHLVQGMPTGNAASFRIGNIFVCVSEVLLIRFQWGIVWPQGRGFFSSSLLLSSLELSDTTIYEP